MSWIIWNPSLQISDCLSIWILFIHIQFLKISIHIFVHSVQVSVLHLATIQKERWFPNMATIHHMDPTVPSRVLMWRNNCFTEYTILWRNEAVHSVFAERMELFVPFSHVLAIIVVILIPTLHVYTHVPYVQDQGKEIRPKKLEKTNGINNIYTHTPQQY